MTKVEIARAAQALTSRVAKSFLKQTEYIYSTFDVGRSMFDVHQFLFRLDRPFFAGGWADTRHLKPKTA